MSENKEKASISEINFLTDQPADEDKFGTHSRVAKAVALTIARDEAIHVIGLLGGWGSGKSTVVRQIEKQLANGDNVYFFNYDAWLHQNDPPRRAFLEELIGDLSQAKIVEATDWELRLAQLSGKAEQTTTETTRQFSETGRAIFLALALVPLGISFLDYDLLEKAFGTGSFGIARPLLVLSVAAVLAPLLVIGCFYFRWRPLAPKGTEGRWKAVGTKEFWSQHDDDHKGQSVIALLTNHSIETAHNQTKISPEPTAIEFRHVFNDLLGSCMVKGKKLVVVIDNLDRLAEEDAMKLWATIRSLFLGSNKALGAHHGMPAPTIILPIDESAIRRMFENQHGDSESKELAESFVDKTFDITFQINEPVMSDWRDFFAGKLIEAFGEYVDKDLIYWATKIVELAHAGSPASKRMTPRKLIKLINSAAALFVQWEKDSIHLLTTILYASHRTEIAKNVGAFVKSDRPEITTAVGDWQRQLLAVHFGVPLEKAYQALLADPIRKAIISNSQESFDNEMRTPGAPEIAEQVVEDIPLDASGALDGDFVFNAAILLANFPGKEEIWTKRSLAGLSLALPRVGPPAAWRPDFKDALAAMRPDPASANEFVAGMSRILGEMIANAKLDEEGLKQIAAMMRDLRDHVTQLDAVRASIHIMRPVDDILKLLPSLDEADLKVVQLDTVSTEFTEGLVDRLGKEGLANTVPAIIRATAGANCPQFKDKKKVVWDTLVQSATDVVSGRSFEDELMGPAVDTLGLLHTKSELAKSHSDQLFDSNRLMTLANEAESEEDWSRLGDLVALMMLRESDFPAPNSKNWTAVAEEQSELVDAVSNALRWYLWKEGLPFALKILPKVPTVAPLIWGLVQQDIEQNEARNVSVTFLLGNIVKIESVLGTDRLDELVLLKSRNEVFWEKILAMSLGGAFNVTVRSLSKGRDTDMQRLVAMVESRLSSVAQDAWLAAILSAKAPFELTGIYRNELGGRKAFGEELRSALHEEVPGLLTADGEVRSRWFKLSELISKSSRITLYRNLRDVILAGAEVNELNELLIIGGFEFLDMGKFNDESDRSSRHIVQPLLRSNSGRRYIEDHIEFFSSVMSRSDEETRNATAEYLNSEVNEDLDDVSNIIKKLNLDIIR